MSITHQMYKFLHIWRLSIHLACIGVGLPRRAFLIFLQFLVILDEKNIYKVKGLVLCIYAGVLRERLDRIGLVASASMWDHTRSKWMLSLST